MKNTKYVQLLETFHMLFSRLIYEYTPKPKHLKTRPEVTELFETEEFSPKH